MKHIISELLFRNRQTREGSRAQKHTVNLEYFRDSVNLGDRLAGDLCAYMLSLKGLRPDSASAGAYTHLMSVGSLLGGRGMADCTVWGSGVKSFADAANLGKKRYIQKLDIRAVRGPITRRILMEAGKYDCPEVYGDPAILLPLLYAPEKPEQRTDVGLILHYLSEGPEGTLCPELKPIASATEDYRRFADELVQCRLVISSSLHGIILAEAYGIPAVFLASGRDAEMIKYYDWYYSTGRRAFPIACSVEEALKTIPAPLPELEKMRSELMRAFPYDLWVGGSAAER